MSTTSLSVKENVDLASLNTLNIHAGARYFVEVTTKQEVRSLFQDSRWNEVPVFILGGGSNVLFVGDFEGLVVRVGIPGKKVEGKDEEYVLLTLGAGENWHKIVRYCVHKGWGGIENLSLIPGTVGAAPIQNIGAYGVELQDVFESLTAVEIKTGDEYTFNKQDCRFGYRDSIFKNEFEDRFVITDMTLKLKRQPELFTEYGAIQDKLEHRQLTEPTVEDISDIIIDIRNSKLPDPAELANAGSFFKNPVIDNSKFEALRKEYPSVPGYSMDGGHTKVPAGWLIEETGWKGKICGNVGVYQQQALVMVNRGGATGEEIIKFARRIQQSVNETFDIELVPEVNIVSGGLHK